MEVAQPTQNIPIQTRPRKPRPVYYPDSDGKPMAETPEHRAGMTYAIGCLEIRYLNRNDAQVSGNDFVYWIEGDPKKRVSPDCYVVFGVEKKARRNYKSWAERGKLPSVVFE